MSFQNEENKLDWMYKGATSLVDREEYLLGRKIDKTLELLNAEEKQQELGITQPKNHVEHECIPPSIRDYNKIQIGEQQVDLATKLQEDPLVAIKKREEETRKQFLQNPIQLKKLQCTLDKQFRKKNKKMKKRENSIDIDVLITEKLQSLRSSCIDFSSITNSSHISDEKDLDKVLIKKFRKYKTHLTENDITEILETLNKDDVTSSSKSDNDEDFIPKSKLNGNKGKWENKNYKKRNHQNEKDGNPRNIRTNLSEQEKERRRKVMMENAAWRDKERTNNVKRYREEDVIESNTKKDYNPNFIHKQLMKSANSGSVESRIKSNINSIQRSKGDMNVNFSKRM